MVSSLLVACLPISLQELLPSSRPQHHPGQLAVRGRLCAVFITPRSCKPHCGCCSWRQRRQHQRGRDWPQPAPCCQPPHCGGQPRQCRAAAVGAVAVRCAEVRGGSWCSSAWHAWCFVNIPAGQSTHKHIKCFSDGAIAQMLLRYHLIGVAAWWQHIDIHDAA